MKTAKILEQYQSEYVESEIVSVARTASSVKNLIAGLGKYDHARLTPSLLRNYRQGEDLAAATINRDFAVLRAALKFALSKGRVRSVLPIEDREGASAKRSWLNPEQVDGLLAASRCYPVIYQFVRFALLTAQRKEAILSLQWRQIDGNVIWFGDHGLRHADRRKGRGSVPISDSLRGLLNELRNDTPFVWVNQRGGRLRDLNADHWKAVVTAAGAPDLTPHGLRHTCATNLIRENVPLIDVSKLLGHANTIITQQIYVDYQPRFLQPAVSALDRLVGGNG